MTSPLLDTCPHLLLNLLAVFQPLHDWDLAKRAALVPIETGPHYKPALPSRLPFSLLKSNVQRYY